MKECEEVVYVVFRRPQIGEGNDHIREAVCHGVVEAREESARVMKQHGYTRWTSTVNGTRRWGQRDIWVETHKQRISTCPHPHCPNK